MGRKRKEQPAAPLTDDKAYEHNRNIKIGGPLTPNEEPYWITVHYLGQSSAFKGVELDHVIMPLIRAALKGYIARRVDPDRMTVEYNSLTDTTLASLNRKGQPDLCCYFIGKVDKWEALLEFYKHPTDFVDMALL